MVLEPIPDCQRLYLRGKLCPLLTVIPVSNHIILKPLWLWDLLRSLRWGWVNWQGWPLSFPPVVLTSHLIFYEGNQLHLFLQVVITGISDHCLLLGVTLGVVVIRSDTIPLAPTRHASGDPHPVLDNNCWHGKIIQTQSLWLCFTLQSLLYRIYL